MFGVGESYIRSMSLHVLCGMEPTGVGIYIKLCKGGEGQWC